MNSRPRSTLTPASHQAPDSDRLPPSPKSQQIASDASATLPSPQVKTSASAGTSSISPLASTHASASAGRFIEDWDASQRGSSIIDGPTRNKLAVAMQRSGSVHSFAAGDDHLLPVRNNTLKKKNSANRRRSNSRRSSRAGSVRSLAFHPASDPEDVQSVFHCPVPTSGTPTDILANRFQTWRKILKDLIAYFREIQSHYEHRSKSLIKLAHVTSNMATPPDFLKSAGIDDALQFLRNYNSVAVDEAEKARDIEEDVILALTGLRSDLQQKIKEIKHLAGDFKNTADREMEYTKKSIRNLTDALDKNEADSASTTGKQDPYLLRLAVDRQVERQIDEENYLHQAYLNLEGSGRELESIVVGEIQKAYNAYAGILKREAENAYGVVEELRDGPISMPKDQEWIHFVTHDDRIVDPTIPMRSPEQIHYPGQDHLAAQEIRAGLLERKTKYLKSYTAGWYVLSTTHLHEFKSADKAQAPVMSLYLPEQKLGSHSAEGGSSNKFILKGRQTGAMHRGHTWIFRAESHDTMMAWYEDIKALTEKTAEERSLFVRTHSRSLSQSSRRSASSDGIVDEDDEEPFAANQVEVKSEPRSDATARRPEPGGRFPSDIQVDAQRGLEAAKAPSSASSDHPEYGSGAQMAAVASLPAAAYVAGGQAQQGNGLDRGTGAMHYESETTAYPATSIGQDDGSEGLMSENGRQAAATRPAATDDQAGFFNDAAAMTMAYFSQGPGAESAPPSRGGDGANIDDGSLGDAGTWMDSSRTAKDEAYEAAEKSAPVGATAAAVSETSIAERQHDAALQAVPELEAADHTTQGATAAQVAAEKGIKPTTGARTESTMTISNLSIPGKFPRGASGIYNP